MTLLIDMGNSRLKWAWLEAGQLSPGIALFNQDLDREALLTSWQNLPTPKRLLIACVSQTALLALVESLALELWHELEIVRIGSKAYAHGVQNAYLQPEKLGVDRWLAVVAAYHRYQTAVCVIDCGTAITVDVVDAQGKHQGGWICPGLVLMKKSLALGTHALELYEGDTALGLANHTQAAIYNGTLAAAVGLVEQVIRQYDSLQLILTGGDAQLVASQLRVKCVVEPDLVLQGLAVFVEYPE